MAVEIRRRDEPPAGSPNRRTAASWFRCPGAKDDWDRFFEMLQTIGKNSASLMLPLVSYVVSKFDPGEQGYWTLVIDDSPTKRFGTCVEAANIHHSPSPAPGDGEWLYGNNGVCVAIALRHPVFGVIALPLCRFGPFAKSISRHPRLVIRGNPAPNTCSRWSFAAKPFA